MRRVLGGLAAVVACAVSLGPSGSSGAAAATQAGAPATGGATAAAAKPHRGDGFGMRQQWAREITRFRDADTSVHHIQHVRELQYRLRWAGTFDKAVNGGFGTATRAAVRRYQREEGVRVTGRAGHVMWAHLIHDTIRRRGEIPHVCDTAGWHACYDRYAHQVTLWHDGEPKNSWLVRGGEYGSETRLGTHPVYMRDVDHVSRLFDAPMPYSQFFDGGQALHGSAYMIDPFVEHSHGCINMYIEDARQLWKITSDKRLVVTVYGPWD